MRASLVLSALSMSLWLFGMPACGGKSEIGLSHGNGNSGGQGGADATGLAGSGAGPATHVTQCEALCARTLDAGCTGDDNACLLVCATVTGYPSCQPQIEAWLSCAEDSAVVCDDSGAPSFTDCEGELALAGACAMMTDPPVAVASSCEDFCSEVDASGCNLSSQLGDCNQACGVTGTVVSKCQALFVDYMQCQTDAGVACDDTGSLVATGCEPEQFIFAGCVMTEVGQGTATQ